MVCMKQKILGGLIGNLALSLRDRCEILQRAYSHPESIGTLANDQLATRLVTAICQPHKIFIDVGAHIGSIISEVAYNDPSIRIEAIEAIPEKIAALQQKFPFARIHHCAAGEFAGEASFFINLKQSGYSSLGRPEEFDRENIAKVTVPIKRLDEIVPSKDIDVIKIDVEGAELGVLRGAVRILNDSRPLIMFESGPQKDDGLGYTIEELYEFLVSKDYVILIPNRVAHNDVGLSRDGFIESHLYPRRTTNYFAIPKERRVEIRDKARQFLKGTTADEQPSTN